MPPKKEEKFFPSGETKRVQSLNGATWVRVFDHDGKSHHLSVDDPALASLVELVTQENSFIGNKIVTELRNIGVQIQDEQPIPLTESIKD